MIQSIHLKNYKSFVDVLIPIRPITVLLGANSTGKSAILNTLLILKQTANECDNTYKSALKINGGSVSIGNAINLFHNKRSDNQLDINIVISQYDKRPVRQLLNDLLSRAKSLVAIASSSSKLLYEDLSRKTLIDRLNLLSDKDKKECERLYHILFPEMCDEEDFVESNNLKIILELLDCLGDNANEIDFRFGIKYANDEKVSLVSLSIYVQEKMIFNYSDKKIKSDLLGISKKEEEVINKSFNGNIPLFYCFDNNTSLVKNREYTFSSYYLTTIIQNLLSLLKDEFTYNAINYTMPLRDNPSRIYVLDKAKRYDMLDCFAGSDVVNALKSNAKIKDEVNRWLRKFGITAETRDVAEYYYFLEICQGELTMNIADVGFGISQILPIVTQGYALKKNMLMIVEQPEIHLHPKMQADVADLLVDICKDNTGGQKKIMVETHSEYLLRRIRRRISEGRIKAEDVAICSFQKDKTSLVSKVEVLDISKKGSFKWPEEFMDDELWDDTLVYVGNQVN